MADGYARCVDSREIFLDLTIAAAGGLLVGLQRERAKSDLAGIRTFPLIAVFGALCAIIARAVAGAADATHGLGMPGVVLISAGLISMAVIVLAGNIVRPASKDNEPHGLTTEIAIFVMYASGVLAGLTMYGPAAAVAASTAVLLHLKTSLHRLTRSLSDDDVRAVMQFAVIAMVIFPVIPNQQMGPFQAINPYKLWLMVVLVTGISLAGYVALRVFGARAGTLLAAVLGGLVSSTATTVSLSRMAKAGDLEAREAAPAIAIANSVMLVRVMVLASVAGGEAAGTLLPPLGLLLLASVAVAGVALFVAKRGDGSSAPVGVPGKQKNPTELRAAFVFAALFAGVQLLVVWGKEQFGTAGLLAIAAISGLTDMDAITLSTAGMARGGNVFATVAASAITLAAIVNTLVKLGIAAWMGGRALAVRLAMLLSLPLVVGLIYLIVLILQPG